LIVAHWDWRGAALDAAGTLREGTLGVDGNTVGAVTRVVYA
jgi:hypothetical protein